MISYIIHSINHSFIDLSVACCDICVARAEKDGVELSEQELYALALVGRLGFRWTDEDLPSEAEQPQEHAKQTRRPAGEGARKAERLEESRDTLRAWRRWCWSKNYRASNLPETILLPDDCLEALARRAHLKTVDAIKQELPQWAFPDKHGQDVLLRLREVDDKWEAERARLKAIAAAQRIAETTRKQEERVEARRQEKHAATIHKKAVEAARQASAAAASTSSRQQYGTVVAIPPIPQAPMQYYHPAHPPLPPPPSYFHWQPWIVPGYYHVPYVTYYPPPPPPP